MITKATISATAAGGQGLTLPRIHATSTSGSLRWLALATGILAGALVVVPTVPVASSVPDTPTVMRIVHSDVNLAASVSAGTAPRARSMAQPGPEPWPEPEPSKTTPEAKTAPAPKASPRGPIPVCPDCGRYPPPPPKVK